MAAAFVLFRFPPDRFAFYPACPFHALTGWDCPGCGSTRALAALLHGELWRALSLNPLLPFFILALGLVWRFRNYVERHESATAYGLGGFLVVLTIARNVLHF
jgi:hypothetical protein